MARPALDENDGVLLSECATGPPHVARRMLRTATVGFGSGRFHKRSHYAARALLVQKSETVMLHGDIHCENVQNAGSLSFL